MKRLTREVSKWDIYQHRSARDLPMVEKDDSKERQLEDEFFDRLYVGNSDPLPETDQGPHGKWATRLHEACGQLPAFGRLQQECAGDVDASATAVETLMKELAPQMRIETEPMMQALGHAKPTDANIRKVLGKGIVVAHDRIDEQREAAESLAQVAVHTPGNSTSQGGAMEQATPRAIADRLKNDARLRRIAMLAGKFTRIAARKQRQKVDHGRDEVTDVEMGSDLARLLPVELGALVHPLRRLALMRDLVEDRAMQYKMVGTDSLGKGPVVVLLDKSGSMAGAPDEWATAVALALLFIAQKQKRSFALLGFDASVKSRYVVAKGGQLPEQALFTACSGGTDIARAITEGLNIVATNEGAMRKADVVLITDGANNAESAPGLRAVAKGLGVTMLGFGIGVGEEDLKPWCDEAQVIRDLSAMDDKTAEKLFTI